jgi:hypothetical protein
MNHREAVNMMAAERYLLDELGPDAREEFEEHYFDCQECALELRAGSAFVDAAKDQLSGLKTDYQVRAHAAASSLKPRLWESWWRPAFAAPVFAAMVLILGFQNLVTLPTLRKAANEPRIVVVAPLHGGTRGSDRPTFSADRDHGLALPIELSAEPGLPFAVSYSFDLRDPQGNIAWNTSTLATAQDANGEQALSIVIPGRMLRNGTYSLTITSVSANGERTAIQRDDFDIVITN